MEKDFLTHVDNSALGTFETQDPVGEANSERSLLLKKFGSGKPKTIDGIEVPPHVLIMIVEAGYDPESFKRGELLEIMHACADGVLVEDNNNPEGHHINRLRDQMETTIQEMAERYDVKPIESCKHRGHIAHAHDSFCEEVEEAREESSAHSGHAHSE